MKNRLEVACITFSCAFVALVLSCTDEKWVEPFPQRQVISIIDSIGVELGDSCLIFGSVADALITPDGSILVLDQTYCVIREYGADGEYIRTLSRKGSGPGEMQYPTEMEILSDGLILVRDQGRRNLILLDRSGVCVQELNDLSLLPPEAINSAGELAFNAVETSIHYYGDEYIAVATPTMYSTYSGMVLHEFCTDTLDLNVEEVLSSLDGLQGKSLLAASNDRLFYAVQSHDKYEVTCWDKAGDMMFEFAMDLPQSAKSQTEIESEIQYAEFRLGVSPGGLAGSFSPQSYNDMILSIGVDARGMLWIQRGTENQPVFDLVDESSSHCASAVFPRTGKYWCFRISEYGSLAWDRNPQEGPQRIYILDTSEILTE